VSRSQRKCLLSLNDIAEKNEINSEKCEHSCQVYGLNSRRMVSSQRTQPFELWSMYNVMGGWYGYYISFTPQIRLYDHFPLREHPSKVQHPLEGLGTLRCVVCCCDFIKVNFGLALWEDGEVFFCNVVDSVLSANQPVLRGKVSCDGDHMYNTHMKKRGKEKLRCCSKSPLTSFLG